MDDQRLQDVSRVSGLGPLPSHLCSVSSTLVYNTNEMPYKKYDEDLDNVFEVKTREKEEEVKKRCCFGSRKSENGPAKLTHLS